MSETTFSEGRYLYCAVTRPEETDPESDDTAISVTGVDDEPIRLVAVGNVAVVIHDCDSLYDTDEIDLVRKWLLEHQQVVDTAGERFGTPLPFQFDTILRGDDDRVREWIGDHQVEIEGYLDRIAGFWEYHVEVMVDEADLEAGLEADDERLGELADRIAEAGSGTAFMLEKQYDQRLEELKRQRRDDRIETLEGRLGDIAREVHDDDTNASSSVLEGDASPDEGGNGGEAGKTYTLAELTLLAHEGRETDVGSVLDDVAAEPGVTVRFTGPWPPYTFAPEIGDEADAGDGDGTADTDDGADGDDGDHGGDGRATE